MDNYINLTVTQGTSAPSGPVNICSGGVIENGGQNDCFTTGYQSPAGSGQLNGQDPDGAITANGGIAPIQIGSFSRQARTRLSWIWSTPAVTSPHPRSI